MNDADQTGMEPEQEPLSLLIEEEWRAIPARLAPHGSATLLPQRQTRLWSLTLEARQIPYRVEVLSGRWQILVPPDSFDAALEELRLFEEKNRNWPPPLPPAPPESDNHLVTLSVLFLFAIFHNLIQLDLGSWGLTAADWVSLGNSHAWAIRHGELWRAVTALTLHADGLHLLGNMAIGGVFILFLCRALGSGLAWSLLIASGTVGNILNAFVQSSTHRSVGASTTVFGAVGLLAAINLLDDRQRLRRRWYLPVAAALALLALLGSEGENTDIGAHLFGFAAGIALGLITAYLIGKFGRPRPRLDAMLFIATVIIVVAAWWLALHYS